MNPKKPNIVVVAHTPANIRAIKNQIEKFWSDYDVFFIINPILGFYKPLYPEPESVKLPYIGDLEWKKNEKEISKVWQVKNQKVIATTLSSLAVLKSAETIVLQGCSPMEVFPFEILLEHNMGKSLKSCLVYIFENYTEREIEKTLKNPSKRNHFLFQKHLVWATAKRYFEYNFNFNSCIVFKSVLQKAGVTDDDFVLTKYVLQLLYAVQDSDNLSEGYMVRMMEEWKGTGLYPQVRMGSHYSYALMFDNLSRLGLLEYNGKSVEMGEHYDFSEKAKKLLKLIHPDCRDIDLPGKIDLWENNWPESKKEMEDYLIQFFRKQMEFVPQEN